MKSNPFVRSLVIFVLCLSLVGCTSAQILSNINLALNAAEAILPIVLPLLNANNPNPVVTPERAASIMAWVQAGLNGLGAVTACQRTGGTAEQLGACVTANLASVVAAVPDLKGLPASIANVVQAFATSLENLLKTYGTKALGASTSAKVIHYGAADQAKLDGFRARIEADHAKIAVALAGK